MTRRKFKGYSTTTTNQARLAQGHDVRHPEYVDGCKRCDVRESGNQAAIWTPSAEPDSPGVALTTKLLAWLEQQPEWLALMAGSRRQRKLAARQISELLLTLPSKAHGVGRVELRQARRRIRRDQVAPVLTKLKARRARELAKAQRMRDRYMRMSVERALELAWAEDAARDAAISQAAMEKAAADLAALHEADPAMD